MVEFVVEASVGPRASPVIRLEQRAPDKLGGARDSGGDCVVGKVRIGDWSFRFDVALRKRLDTRRVPDTQGTAPRPGRNLRFLSISTAGCQQI